MCLNHPLSLYLRDIHSYDDPIYTGEKKTEENNKLIKTTNSLDSFTFNDTGSFQSFEGRDYSNNPDNPDNPDNPTISLSLSLSLSFCVY